MKKFTSKFIMFVLVALLALTAVGCGGKTKIPTEELDALKAELEQLKSDKAALESAKGTLESEKAVLEAAKAELEAKKAALEAEKAALEAAGAEKEAELEAAKEAAKAELEAAEAEKGAALKALYAENAELVALSYVFANEAELFAEGTAVVGKTYALELAAEYAYQPEGAEAPLATYTEVFPASEVVFEYISEVTYDYNNGFQSRRKRHL